MLHLDEARENAIGLLEKLLAGASSKAKAVLIEDLFGRLRVILWAGDKKLREPLRQQIDEGLRRASEVYWTGEIWHAAGVGKAQEVDEKLYDKAWDDAEPSGTGKLRILDRHRNRRGWFENLVSPLWEGSPTGPAPGHPPIVVFYSFKGGVGRTTALASVAIQRARLGERVVVIDADLDAPGLGTLLSPSAGAATRWGVVDYLLERPRGEVVLADYYHLCRREKVTKTGEICVFPAGRVDSSYLGKLARLDLEPSRSQETALPFGQLLQEIRTSLEPHWIFIDTRAGLAEPAGMLLGGMAHLHVLFGTFSDQSWAGLRLVIERIGASQVRRQRRQGDCLIVQAMIPENLEVSDRAQKKFSSRAYEELTDLYYAAEATDDSPSSEIWTVGDSAASDAPHIPVSLSYNSRLADFSSIDVIADYLATASEYNHLGRRIAIRFGAEP
ncbi:MAG: hypothetical protein HC897_10640 [Thermoanaerobaculia bacterium]|nr:hypothetical protein [Thermoanaerobaculia bacterium]